MPAVRETQDWDETVVFDQQHLLSFTGEDVDLQKEVLGIFADNAPQYLKALHQAPDDEWVSASHKLKGAARGIGAWRLAREAERAELMGNSKSGDPVRQKRLDEMTIRLAELIKLLNDKHLITIAK